MAGVGGIGRVAAASVRLGNEAAGKIVAASTLPNGKLSLDGLAAGIAHLAKSDPKAAAVATETIAKRLGTVDRGRLPGEIAEAVRDQQRSAQPTPRGLTGEQKELMLDLGQIGLDIVGLVDPTPVSDGLNGIVSLFRGDFLGAGISAVSMIPYIGDAAKLGKLGKWSKTIDRAISIASAAPNSAMAKAMRPAIDKIADGLNAIPAGVLDKLPASARNQIIEMRAKANGFLSGTGSFDVTVRGQRMTLDNVTTQTVNYTKRDRVQYEALRKAFDSTARADFAKAIATTPAHKAALQKAGLNDAQIARLADGKIPQGWQVHHKLPLDDGGTNAFSNLVLIKNDPYHIGITNVQRQLVGDLTVGASRTVDFPIPNGIVYPPK